MQITLNLNLPVPVRSLRGEWGMNISMIIFREKRNNGLMALPRLPSQSQVSKKKKFDSFHLHILVTS